MQFGDFLGNDRLKDRLASAFSKGAVSHAYLIAGPKGSGKHTLARLLGAALQCESENRPCLTCTACRKALSGQHPDVITVDDPDRRILPVDLIRKMSADAAIRPNEGIRKVYLIPRAQDMQAPAQNALLKIIEEPPAYGAFLLLTENADGLLSTVRSRCVELALSPLSRDVLRRALSQRCPDAPEASLQYALDACEGYLGRALELIKDSGLSPDSLRFCEAFAQRDDEQLLRLTTSLEKRKREELSAELRVWQRLVASALKDEVAAVPSGKRLGEKRTRAELLAAIETLKKADTYLSSNVSAAMVAALLAVELR